MAELVGPRMCCSCHPGIDSQGMSYNNIIFARLPNFLAFWDYICFQRICAVGRVSSNLSAKHRLSGRFDPTTFLFNEAILSNSPCCWSNLHREHYSLIIRTTSSVHFTTLHTNLIEQTISSIHTWEGTDLVLNRFFQNHSERAQPFPHRILSTG